MDLSESQRDSTAAADEQRWCDWLRLVGGEAAQPLTSALERVDALAASGQVPRESLDALRREIAGARRTAMLAQQLARHGAGRLRQNPEPLDLSHLLRQATETLAPALKQRGVRLGRQLVACQVVADPAMLLLLFGQLFDWAGGAAKSKLGIELSHSAWPVRAQLECRFDRALPGHPTALDTLSWHLLDQVARTMGLAVAREVADTEVKLVLSFPRTIDPATEAAAGTRRTRQLAGSHILGVMPQRELRAALREALHPLGVMLDFVSSVEDARAFCQGGLPHAVVYASVLRGAKLKQMRESLAQRTPPVVFVEILEDGPAYDIAGMAGQPVARVGRDEIATGLAASLLLELSKIG